jgi:hypothetical protein
MRLSELQCNIMQNNPICQKYFAKKALSPLIQRAKISISPIKT